MMNMMKVVISILILILCFIDRCVVSHPCGMLLGVQFSCPAAHHCCDETKYICCGNAYICSGDGCLHLAAIIIPCLIAVGVTVGIIICCVCCKKKAQSGTIIQAQGVQQQTFEQPPPYGQPAYGQPAYGQPEPSFGEQQQQKQQEELE